jgi:hypothetical protein
MHDDEHRHLQVCRQSAHNTLQRLHTSGRRTDHNDIWHNLDPNFTIPPEQKGQKPDEEISHKRHKKDQLLFCAFCAFCG